LGKHRVYVAGDKIQNNDFMDYREYTLYADLVAAVAGYGALDAGKNFWCTETGRYYYWNGGALLPYPSTGGAGAPSDASYLTINAEPALSGETRHELLTNAGGHLHEPLYHKLSHQDAGLDEINVAGLSGVLADDQDAAWIKGHPVNTPAVWDDLKFLQYDDALHLLKWTAIGGGGDMLKADYALDAVRVKLAVDSDTLDGSHAASFAGIVHKNRHISGGADSFLTFGAPDLLDGIARITVRKNTGANVGSRRRINFIEGTGISFTITDVGGSEEVTVRVDATGAGLGGTWSTGICSGRSPIVTPHSLGGVPTLVLASINAAQPYPSPCWTADATNITFRHAVTAGCTITFAARL
jgi:hypothetical protein